MTENERDIIRSNVVAEILGTVETEANAELFIGAVRKTFMNSTQVNCLD